MMYWCMFELVFGFGVVKLVNGVFEFGGFVNFCVVFNIFEFCLFSVKLFVN